MLSNLNKPGPVAGAGPRRRGVPAAPTSKEKLLTHGDRTMMDIWQQEAGDGGGAAGRNAGGQLLDAPEPASAADRRRYAGRTCRADALHAHRATRSIASSSARPIPIS